MRTINCTSDKHAYLVMYHKNSRQLIQLLQTLDDERNDIFIHADKKTEDFPEEALQNAVKRSRLYFVKRIKVTWGGYSQMKAMMTLLEAATKNGKYAYYHLLSGQDLPIKPQDDIHNYFWNHTGKEFLRVRSCVKDDQSRQQKLAFFLFFREHYISVKKENFFTKAFKHAEELSVFIQNKLRINRIRGKEAYFYSGSTWFSITHSFAEYILGKKAWIRRHFAWTACSDEVFIHTIAMHSPFQSVLHTSMRLIDWKRGTTAHPYVFRNVDFDLLSQSDCLFARKFDADIDAKIIDRVVSELCCPKRL